MADNKPQTPTAYDNLETSQIKNVSSFHSLFAKNVKIIS